MYSTLELKGSGNEVACSTFGEIGFSLEACLEAPALTF